MAIKIYLGFRREKAKNQQELDLEISMNRLRREREAEDRTASGQTQDPYYVASPPRPLEPAEYSRGRSAASAQRPPPSTSDISLPLNRPAEFEMYTVWTNNDSSTRVSCSLIYSNFRVSFVDDAADGESTFEA